MTRLTRLVGLTRLVSPESTRLPTVVSARLRHVLTSSTVGVASRRQLSFTGGKLIKFKPSVPTPLAFHTRAPEPEDDFVPNPAVKSFRDEEAGRRSRRRRKELPEELMENVVKLTCASTAPGGVCDVYVVGTVHYTEESCIQVRAIIRFVKPEAVFLELCTSRMAGLYPREKMEMPTIADMINMWKESRDIFGIMFYWLCVKARIESNAGPDSEFIVAAEEAVKCGASALILGDRPMEITTQRAARNMPLWLRTLHVFTFVYRILVQGSSIADQRSPKDHIEKTETDDGSFSSPALQRTMVDERDRYMTIALHDVAKSTRTVVAVVGKGHLKGIKQNWNTPLPMSELEELQKIHPEDPKVKVLAFVGVALAGTAIISGLYGMYHLFM